MRATRIKLSMACLASLLAGACDWPGYHGFGEFTDNGAGATQERYVVDFGPVDLGKSSRKSFKMAGLPPVEFTMGLRPVSPSSGCDAATLSAINVRVEMHTGDGILVMAEEGPLSTWVTSTNLIYRRGAEQGDGKTGDASARVRSGVLPSGGWGTYFTPQTSTTYLVNFRVLGVKGAPGCESRLVLVSAGGK
jgi:hypothetical protein